MSAQIGSRPLSGLGRLLPDDETNEINVSRHLFVDLAGASLSASSRKGQRMADALNLKESPSPSLSLISDPCCWVGFTKSMHAVVSTIQSSSAAG